MRSHAYNVRLVYVTRLGRSYLNSPYSYFIHVNQLLSYKADMLTIHYTDMFNTSGKQYTPISCPPESTAGQHLPSHYSHTTP